MQLTMNEDGSLNLPLRGGRTVVLPEPSLRMFATIWDLMTKADKDLPEVDDTVLSMPANERTPAQLVKLNEENQARSAAMYTESSPHALALIDIVAVLTEGENQEHLTIDDLPAAAGNPQVIAQIVSHFQVPLPGPDAVQ